MDTRLYAIRIIVATNGNLEGMVKNQFFREDLWLRLNVFPIWIPPLRDMQMDIPSLIQHFIRTKGKVNGPYGAAAFFGINPGTLRNGMKKLGIAYGRKTKF